MSTIDKSITNTAVPTVPEWNELPCVRYGFPDDSDHPRQALRLRTIFEPVPQEANTASPIYLLKRDEYEKQYSDRYEKGYEVSEYTSIATKLQDKCEDDGRVLYPIYVESDEFWNHGPEQLCDWSERFIEDRLGVSFNNCTLYFSGNRSIHVHVPRFVSSDAEVSRLKDEAEEFCKETGAELDCGIYSRKRQFRIPGVEHEKRGIPKLEVDGDWNQAEMSQKVLNEEPDIPDSYEEVLRHVFLKDSLTVDSADASNYTPHDFFRILDAEKTVLNILPEKREIETPLIERTEDEYPDDPVDQMKWHQYNAKEFSPYALAKENGRSVAALQVKGTPFGRKNVTGGNFTCPAYALVPAYFYGAQGCAGETFTKSDEHAPLQLSKGDGKDYQKWEKHGFQPGDHVVIIGGQSKSSIFLEVDAWQATIVGHELTGDDGSRQGALEYLEEEGYDTGSAGQNASNKLTARLKRENNRASTNNIHSEEPEIFPARDNPRSPAEKYQLIAERDGIEKLSYPELVSVACKHLQYGWEPTWEWFSEQFGSNFNPEETWTHLQNIVTSWPQDYSHIEVPPKP